MAYVDVDGDRIVAVTDFTEKDLIRQVPGFTWDPDRKAWVGPLSWGTCQTLRGVFGQHRLVNGPGIVEWSWREWERRISPCLALRELTDGEGDPRLMSFQKPGVSFLAYARRALLGDDLGTGKTVQTIMALNMLESVGETVYPLCIICPNAVKFSWEEHFATWADDVQTFVISAGSKKAKTLKAASDAITAGERVALIINWEAVRLHSRLAPYGSIRLKRCSRHGGGEESVTRVAQCEVHEKELDAIPFRTVVCDEAHKQKDPTSKQTRASWAVQHRAEFRFSLTGTPVANHPGDLWAIMHGVSPEDYPTKTKYNERFCMMAWSAFGGLDIIGVRADTRDEYFRILDPRFRRMPKSLVLTELPDKVRIKRYVEMNPKQAKAYKDIAEGMVTRLDDGRLVVTTNSMVQNLRLLQFCSSYAEVDAEGHVHLSDPSSKIDALMEELDGLDGKPVVIAAESRQLIELAIRRIEDTNTKKKHGEPITWRAVIGGQTDDQRRQSLKDFTDGHARVLLFTIKAGGTGLNLTRADTIIFLQRSWSMLENKQAEDRVHRIGSEIHESVTVIDIIARDTVEIDQIQRLYEKAERLEEITRDKIALARAAAAGDDNAQRQLDMIQNEEQEIINSDLTGVDLLRPVEAV